MLQRLADWRAQCTEAELAGFERELIGPCTKATTPNALHKRYRDSFHLALINGKIMSAAIKTGDVIRGIHPWDTSEDTGYKFCLWLANQGGVIAIRSVDSIYAKSIGVLLRRGILFEHDGHDCLPIELVMELRRKALDHSWMTLVAQTPLAMLYQIVPDTAQSDMLQPKAIRNQLTSWLVLEGQKARQGHIPELLGNEDWAILLSVRHHELTTFEELEKFFPGLEAVRVNHGYYYHEYERISLRQTLMQHIPERLLKLCRLGLLGIQVRQGDEYYAAIVLCDEAKAVLKPHFEQVCKRIAVSIEQQWQSDICDVEVPSPWSMDQHIWQLWITLHFLPLGVTQQGQLRKHDIKKISKATGMDDVTLIEFLLFSMLDAALLTQQDGRLLPATVNWSTWAKHLRTSIYNIVKSRQSWTPQDQRNAYALLAQLPIERWLKLDDVVTWLQLKATGNLIDADWQSLFTEYQNGALHHFNQSHACIYLLPIFQAVLKQQPVSFPAPGWHGADKQAKVHGFISAAGEIQLPPDCNHNVLDKLAKFCTISSVEQMITLQLDSKALQRMGTDKTALKRTRKVLESLRTPLPQAVAYLFNKQQSQTPVAAVAAASMVMVLNEASAIHKLRKTGFNVSQPFKDKPEIVVLDASADAYAFMQHCADAGILLDTLIKPVLWISGTASIKAWMDMPMDRTDRWLEICYQKQRNSKPKQIIARIEYNDYGEFEIRGGRKTRQGYALLKSTVSLQPKHVLRLRELDATEMNRHGLDKL